MSPAPARDGTGGAPARNPYLNRVMIRDVSQFYGRRREVAKIFARIGASRPQSVAIVGERRIGKSSLLAYLSHPDVRRQHLEDPDAYTFVLSDLQEQREIGVSAFFANLFEAIEAALGRERPVGVAADYEGARRAISRLHAEGRRIILLFDEFDAITRNPNFPEEFFSFLRAVANKYDVAYVTTSGRDLQQLCHADRIADSPFFNIFSNLFLTRFERDEALQLIREPSAAAGVPLESHTRDILDIAGLFPFFLQIACSAFFEQLAERESVDMTAAREGFLEEAEPHFNYFYEHLDDNQRAVLADLAEDRAIPPSRAYLLNRFRRDGYILEDQGRERLFSSVFADYVRQRHTRQPPSAAPAPQHDGEPPATYPPAPGDRLSHFRIVRLLGRGGMGLVFLAEDLRLGRPVALKVLPPEVVADPDRKRRFLQEARAASSLTHPNIAVVHEVDEVDGISLIAMERIEGVTLRERITAGPLSLADLTMVGTQAAEALAAAHARGIIHRDIKPENIMIAADDRVKVLDFGLAKLGAGGEDGAASAATMELPLQTQVGVTLGTVKYMSPEQVAGKAVDGRSDIFALGVVLYEMATGRTPFAGATSVDLMHAILHEPVSAAELQDVSPPALQRLVARALEKEPARRQQSMLELAAELRAVTASTLSPRTSLGERLFGWLR